MAALTLPDLSSLTGSRDGVLGALGDVAKALPAAPGNVTASLDGGTANLHASLDVDLSSLTGDLATALGSITSRLPSGQIPELQQLSNGLATGLAALEPLRDLLTQDGDFLDLASLAMKQIGDPVARVTELLGPLTNVLPADAIQTLETFIQTVTAFESSIPTNVDDIASFVARGFLGVPSDLLAPARGALDGFLGGIGALVPAAQVDAIHAAAVSLAAEFQTAQALVVALDPADVPGFAAAVTALTQLRDHVKAFVQQVAALAGSVRAGLGALDASGFLASVEAALAAVPDVRVPDTRDFVDFVIDPIRQLNVLVDTVTPEQVALQIRGWKNFVGTELMAEGLEELAAIVRKPFEVVGDAIGELHLEKIRDAYKSALGEVGDAIETVTGAIAAARGALLGAVNSAGGAVDALTGAVGEVETVLNELASAVESAAGSVSLGSFHDEALGLVQTLSTDVADLVEGAAEALGELHELIAKLGEIDLEDSASGAVDAIGTITEALDAVDVAMLPDALLSELKSALTSLLDSISLQPVHDALSGVIEGAPLDVLDEFTSAYDALLHQLEEFSPTGLLEPLQAPFDAIVQKLNDLRPGDLLDPVIAQLEQAKTALDGLSPAALLAPLQAPLAEARAGLESVAPEKLLAPLHQPFADLLAIVDKLDGKAALDAIQSQLTGWMEQGLTGLQGMGGSFSSGSPLSGFVDGAAGATPSEFGLRPGDILLPVQELYEKVVGLLDRVPIGTLLAAFEQLREVLVGTLDALSPGNLHAHVHGHVEELVAKFDLSPGAELLGDLLPRSASLTLAVDAIDPARVPAAAQANHAKLVSLTAEIDLGAALAPARTALTGLRSDAFGVSAGLDVSGLASSYGRVAARLKATLPDFLLEPLTEQSLRAHLDALNPKHIADEVNHEFDLLANKITKFAEVFATELPPVVEQVEQQFAQSLDGLIRGIFEAVHAPLRAQVQALDPAALEATLNAEVYDPIRAALASLSPEAILGDAGVTARFEASKAALAGVISSLRNLQTSLSSGFDAAVDGVIAVSPRQLEADLQAAYAPIADALGELDLGGLSEELQAQFQRLGDQVVTVLQEVLDALKAMVAAIPSGIEGVNAEIDLSVRA